MLIDIRNIIKRAIKYLLAPLKVNSCFPLHNTLSVKYANVFFQIETKAASVLSVLASYGFNDPVYIKAID